MFVTKKHLSRRTVLRGAGVAMALPLLDAMLPAFAQSPAMEPYRAYITTINGLQAPPGEQDNGGVHMGASAAFLNGRGPVNKHDSFGAIESKKSVDQYIADAIAGDTPLHSLEVGTEDMGTSAGACDGYPCTFFNTMAWR